MSARPRGLTWWHRRLRLGIVAVLAITVLSLLAAVFVREGAASPRPPNIVVVLTDDLSWNLVRYMPHVQQMEAEGVTFSRYFVTDSLCCPSRASIFTGRFPHNTGVVTNTGFYGGWKLFHDLGEERSTFATQLQSAGYLTALMGKYMNGYLPDRLVDGRRTYIPPGWTEWDVGGNAYANFDYQLNENGRVVSYGHGTRDYLTDVLANKGSAFIDRAARARRPFLLEVASFTPHAPFTPAPRNLNDFPGLSAPRTPAFDERNLSDKPNWLRYHAHLRTVQLSDIDTEFRRRAQAVESVDALLGRLQDTLRSTGQLANTYVFFSSDNGYHLGEHRLAGGKMTAFETDIRVPLVVTGPGLRAGRTIGQLASNTDLYPTFVRLAGLPVPASVDGHSLLPLFASRRVPGWRRAVLVEHHGPDRDLTDPDYPPPQSGNPMSYKAIRTRHAVYVEYVDGEREYYNLRRDPYELRNTAALLSRPQRKSLHGRLRALSTCAGASACWHAAGGH